MSFSDALSTSFSRFGESPSSLVESETSSFECSEYASEDFLVEIAVLTLEMTVLIVCLDIADDPIMGLQLRLKRQERVVIPYLVTPVLVQRVECASFVSLGVIRV